MYRLLEKMGLCRSERAVQPTRTPNLAKEQRDPISNQ